MLLVLPMSALLDAAVYRRVNLPANSVHQSQPSRTLGIRSGQMERQSVVEEHLWDDIGDGGPHEGEVASARIESCHGDDVDDHADSEARHDGPVQLVVFLTVNICVKRTVDNSRQSTTTCRRRRSKPILPISEMSSQSRVSL